VIPLPVAKEYRHRQNRREGRKEAWETAMARKKRRTNAGLVSSDGVHRLFNLDDGSDYLRVRGAAGKIGGRGSELGRRRLGLTCEIERKVSG
jgi:hypothetical protein